MAVLRFWGDKPQELLDILHFDTPIGWFVFEGKHAKALSKIPVPINADGEVVPGWDEVDKQIVRDDLDKYIKARAEYNKSYCVLGMFKFGNNDPEFYFIRPKYIQEMKLKPGTKEITKFIFTPPIEYMEDFSNKTPIEVNDMSQLRLMGDFDRDFGRFRSRYESIIDNLVGLSILDQQLVLLTIRVGSGVRYILVKEAILSDSDARKELQDTLENMGMNTLMVVPVSSLEENDFQLKLDFGDGTPPIEWTNFRQNLLRGVSLRIGAPEETLNGAEIGMRSAETNQSMWLQSLDQEQEQITPDWIWYYKVRWGLESTEALDYPPFQEPDEATAVQLFMNKVMALEKAQQVAEKAGMPLEYILKELNFDYEIDQAMIDEFNKRREEMAQPLNPEGEEGSIDDTTNPSDRQEEEEEED